jgi:hypothetical protein
MQRLLNALKAQSAALDASAAQPRFGMVTSFDPSTYTARVLLQPEGVLSGWLPVLTAWAGNGWGLVCPPSPGQQVLVVAQEGEAEHGIIAGAAHQPAAACSEWGILARTRFRYLSQAAHGRQYRRRSDGDQPHRGRHHYGEPDR